MCCDTINNDIGSCPSLVYLSKDDILTQLKIRLVCFVFFNIFFSRFQTTIAIDVDTLHEIITFLLIQLDVQVVLRLGKRRVAVKRQPLAFPVLLIIEERSGHKKIKIRQLEQEK